MGVDDERGGRTGARRMMGARIGAVLVALSVVACVTTASSAVEPALQVADEGKIHAPETLTQAKQEAGGEEIPGYMPSATCEDKREAQAGANTALSEANSALGQAVDAYESALRDKVKAEEAFETAKAELASAQATKVASETARDNAENAYKQAEDATTECIAKYGGAADN